MAASEAWVRPILAAALIVVAPSCAMDDRTLYPAEPGEETATEGTPLTSSGSGGATSETATRAASSGGSGGSAGRGSSGGGSTSGGSGGVSSATETTGSVPESECPDLNQNQVSDCDETLVLNATFAADTESWEAESSAAIRWEGVDSESASGVLVVTHAGESAGESPAEQHTMAGSFQCVPVLGRSTYGLFAESFIPEGQGEALAAISAQFYASSDCSGNALDVLNSPMQAGSESWRVVHGSGIAPERAQSSRVRLVAVKAEEEAAVEVRFDNVLVIRE